MQRIKFPFFSIIIPTYNSSHSINDCFKSVLNQSYNNYEILVIDGLSTDCTSKIVQSYNDAKISFMSSKDNGIYDAMNKGIAVASGDYLLFLGSDDTLYNNQVLQKIANKISATNAKVIYGNVKMQGDSELVKNGTIYGNEFDLKRLLVHNIPHQAIFYHKSVFKELGIYNLKYKILADHDFNLRAISKFTFHYDDLTVANFAVGGSSTTMIDESFELDRYKNFINYFINQIHRKEFSDIRLYIKEAALNKRSQVAPLIRIYCLIIYSKLKLQSLFN
ncbi:MAG: glycosyltransferase family 2 protein [Pedobacter agri]